MHPVAERLNFIAIESAELFYKWYIPMAGCSGFISA